MPLLHLSCTKGYISSSSHPAKCKFNLFRLSAQWHGQQDVSFHTQSARGLCAAAGAASPWLLTLCCGFRAIPSPYGDMWTLSDHWFGVIYQQRLQRCNTSSGKLLCSEESGGWHFSQLADCDINKRHSVWKENWRLSDVCKGMSLYFLL